MAVFLINICKFNGCGITFPSLGDLIQHIEDTHIDYDPQVIEQKEQARPSCLPLSYVLRFITDAARKEGPFLGTSGAELKRKLAIKHHSYSMSSSNRSNTPTDMGSEMDEDEMMVSESEDSNDSWTTEEFSSEFIMRYGSRHSGPVGNSTTNEKPFACPVPGCKKRYKNVNGIKYHSKNGHKKDGKVRKGYKCHCGKSYKTPQGLKNHTQHVHNGNSTTNSSGNATNNNGSDSGSIAVLNAQPSGSQSPCSASNGSTSNNSSSNHSMNAVHLLQPPQPLQQQPQQQQHHHQSTNNQLSPNSNSVSSSVSSSSSAAAVNMNGNNSSSCGADAVLMQSSKSHFGAMAMKTKTVVASHKTGDHQLLNHPPYGNNSNPQPHNSGHIVGGNNNNNGVRQNLPSLVNFGILTPATSPKQQQQQPAPATPLTPSNSGVSHPLLQQQQQQQIVMQQQQHMMHAPGAHSAEHITMLPLTPISPNMSKNMQFTPTSSATINHNSHNNNNNNHIIHCNNNNVAAEHLITDDT